MQSVIYVFEVLINVDSWVSVTGLVRSQKFDQDLYWTVIILGNYSQLIQTFLRLFLSPILRQVSLKLAKLKLRIDSFSSQIGLVDQLSGLNPQGVQDIEVTFLVGQPSPGKCFNLIQGLKSLCNKDLGLLGR